tara:strand:+ start:8665 stop:9255 length:591 start_codon:yes stop_codon:yes gene_type:complete
MALKATPMGAEPVGTTSASGSFSGKTRYIPIKSAEGTSIFYGDFVKLVLAGGVVTVAKDTGTATLTPVGIFLGCTYTDPNTKQTTFAQSYNTSIAASDINAIVLDDPSVEFRMQANGSVAAGKIGSNVAVVQTAGATALGRSHNSINAGSAATTNTLPIRILGFVQSGESTPGDAYTDLIVTFNAGMHAYDKPLGT